MEKKNSVLSAVKTGIKDNSLPIIALMAITIAFLMVWKSGVETAPKKRHLGDEDVEDTGKSNKSKAISKDTSSSEHIVIIGRQRKRCTITESQACHKIDCQDGKVICTNNYTILNE